MPSGRPHSVYIDDDLWDAALERAESDRTSIARVINSGLRSYLGIDVPMQTVTSAKPPQAVKLEDAGSTESVDDNPFGGAEATEGAAPQQESAIASDVATAQITRPADRLNAKAALTKPVGSGKGGSHQQPKSIDQERLERMNAMKYGKHK